MISCRSLKVQLNRVYYGTTMGMSVSVGSGVFVGGTGVLVGATVAVKGRGVSVNGTVG